MEPVDIEQRFADDMVFRTKSGHTIVKAGVRGPSRDLIRPPAISLLTFGDGHDMLELCCMLLGCTAGELIRRPALHLLGNLQGLRNYQQLIEGMRMIMPDYKQNGLTDGRVDKDGYLRVSSRIFPSIITRLLEARGHMPWVVLDARGSGCKGATKRSTGRLQVHLDRAGTFTGTFDPYMFKLPRMKAS